MGEELPQPLPDEGEWISIAGGGKREASQQLAPSKGKLCLFFFFFFGHFFLYLFIWLSRVFMAARRIFVAPHGLFICSTQI